MKTDLKSTSSGKDLRAAIETLERAQSADGRTLRQHFMRTYESMRPLNLIKGAFTEITESQELKGHVFSSGMGLVAGHLSKRVYEIANSNGNSSIIGTVIQVGVTNAVARNPEVVQAAGRKMFRLAYAAWKGTDNTIGNSLETK